jgi:hypothetical protein
MLTRGNEADGALQPGAAEKEFLEVPYIWVQAFLTRQSWIIQLQ